MVDPTIANMGDGASRIVELKKGHRSTHLLLRAIVLSIERVVCRTKSCTKVIIDERALSIGADRGKRCAHSLTHRSTRDITTRVTTHTVADDEETILILCGIMGWENRVLLALTLTKLVDCICL